MSFTESERVNPSGFTGRDGFDPSQHPRNTDGKFAEKTGASPEVMLDSISVNDTTATERFLSRSDAAWSRFRGEQEELRKELPAVIGEVAREKFPDATGIIFETETSSDGRVITGYNLISVEGPELLTFQNAVDDEHQKLYALQDSLGDFSDEAIEFESDIHEAATIHSSNTPNTQWKMTF